MKKSRYYICTFPTKRDGNTVGLCLKHNLDYWNPRNNITHFYVIARNDISFMKTVCFFSPQILYVVVDTPEHTKEKITKKYLL